MSSNLIPHGPRIPLPAPDYEERMKHAAWMASPGRKVMEMEFRDRRASKLARRAFRKLPKRKRRWEKWIRENAGLPPPPGETIPW